MEEAFLEVVQEERIKHLKAPHWPDDPPPEISYALCIGNKPISVLRVWKREFSSPCLMGGAWAIGQVWTDPEYRGKGYATQLLNKVLDSLKARSDRQFVFLIAENKKRLYLKVGFLAIRPSFEKTGQVLWAITLSEKLHIRASHKSKEIIERWYPWELHPKTPW